MPTFPRDLTGLQFGRLTVLNLAETRNEATHWLCRCRCGTEKTIRRDGLTTGRVKGCGCGLTNKDPIGPQRVEDLSGRRFGMLTVQRRSEKVGKSGAQFVCLCDCGIEVIATKRFLLIGSVVSCGCKSEAQVKSSAYPNGIAALRPFEPPKKHRRWVFRCFCGNDFTAVPSAVRRGATTSCGCYRTAFKLLDQR